MRKTMTRASATVAAVLLCVSAAGCSDDSGGKDDTSSDPTSQAGEATSPADEGEGDDSVAAAQALVDEALSPSKTYPASPGAFDPGDGKAVVIAQGFQIPVIQAMAQEAVKAYEALGWEVSPALDGELNPATFGGQLDQAVQEGATAVTFVSTPLSPIKPAVERAIEAGVAITCVNCDITADIHDLGVEDASVDFQEQGRIIAASIIARTGGKANVLVTEEPAQQTVVDRVIGLEAGFADCSGCEVQKVTIPAADSVAPGPPQWTSFLTQNPDGGGITDAVAYYDGLTLNMATTLKQQGRTDIALSGFDADEAPVGGIVSGDLAVVADLAIPYEYQVWAAVDLAARIATGAELWDASKMPSTLLDSSNASDYEPYIGPDGDWRAEFQTSWGQG
jgi:ABC-type sugar transport system substrate-binding protein